MKYASSFSTVLDDLSSRRKKSSFNTLSKNKLFLDHIFGRLSTVELAEEDIPEIPALRWWLLCHEIQVPKEGQAIREVRLLEETLNTCL